MPPRASGILLHVSSLPSPHGIGDLGAGARAFVDWLRRAGQSLWQVLPLVPTGLGHSPYASPSTFAGNPDLLSPEALRDAGLLENAGLTAPDFPAAHVDFGRALPHKARLLRAAAERFGPDHPLRADYDAFCAREAEWLDDYALFMALKEAFDGLAWTDWPRPLRLREETALAEARRAHAAAIERHRLGQFLFDRQWAALRAYAAARGVRIVGDLPIYVALDSADVWARPDLFRLDADGQPTEVAGVPPDYFSETGQLWGNPLYRWDRMAENGFRWWTRRVARTLQWVDLVRLDHFRAFEAFWSVPAGERTAENGAWEQGPGDAFFEAMERAFGAPLPFVAEDLGLITEEVTALRDRFGLPGMVVLQFAFGSGPDNPYLPHRYARNAVAYTGTHDNDTFAGWWASADADVRAHARAYLGLDHSGEPPYWAALRWLMASSADTVVTPLQDVLGLGNEARMNVPGKEAGNWAWRATEAMLPDALADALRTLTALYGRLPAADAAGGSAAKAEGPAGEPPRPSAG